MSAITGRANLEMRCTIVPKNYTPFSAAVAAVSVLALLTNAACAQTGSGRVQQATPVKLSVVDNGVASPAILATADGALHVIYVEQQRESPYMLFLYYRSSRDGGKSWTAPKNISEVLPNVPVGNTKLLADSSGRIYAIWRSSWMNGFGDISQPASQGDGFNLVYRVLQNGAWSNAIYIHPPTTSAKQQFGSASWFAANDPSTGKVQVLWNTRPAPRHPESYAYGFVSAGIKLGALMRVVLDGANASQPEEFFHSPIFKGDSGPSCEGFDGINGYIDNSGQPHVLAQALKPGVSPEPAVRFQLIENNQQYAALELPGQVFTYWQFPPTLLVDAQGRRHAITMYAYSELQSVRDYTLGSNTEPQIVRAAKASTGKVLGVQAFQGPGGRMAALIQMADTNPLESAETYLVTNDGHGPWTTPINLTNNAGRAVSKTTATGSRSSVTTMSSWYPGNGAAAYDAAGHLYVAFIVNRKDLFGESAYGVSLAGGSSSVPQLLFVRF